MEGFEKKKEKGGYSPSINLVLKNFQATAERSLSGPTDLDSSFTGRGNVAARLGRLVYPAVDRKFRPDRPRKNQTLSVGSYLRNDNRFPSFLQTPLLLAQDSSVTETTETELEGETITCFVVGGEKRLCMPEVLKKVLNCFELSQIHHVYEELNIFTSLCSTSQLYTLKCEGILPASAATCGLITVTDAERLCSTLLRRYGNVVNVEPASAKAIQVMHQCFGKCTGVFHLDLYKSSSSRAVQCRECDGMFSPSEFVCHAHHALENRTCHWGFDSSKWHIYMKVSKDENTPGAKQLLDGVKSIFEKEDSDERHLLNNDDSVVIDHNSDHVDNEEDDDKEEEIMTFKRQRYDDRNGNSKFESKSFHVSSSSCERKRYESPILLQRQRNISSEQPQQQLNRHFAPNVSLTPESYKKELSDDVHSHLVYFARSGSHSQVQAVQFQRPISSPPPSDDGREFGEAQPLPLPSFRGGRDHSEFQPQHPFSRNGRERSEFQPLTPSSRNGRDDSVVLPDHRLHMKDLEKECIVTEMELSQLWRLEIDLLNSSLENSASETKDHVINDYIGIQKEHVTLASKLIAIQRSLQQELHKFDVKMKIKEEEILKRSGEKEFENISTTNRRKLKETEEENRRLRTVIETMVNGSKRSDIGLMKAKYKAQVEHFKRKLQCSERLKETNLKKLSEMRETIRPCSTAAMVTD